MQEQEQHALVLAGGPCIQPARQHHLAASCPVELFSRCSSPSSTSIEVKSSSPTPTMSRLSGSLLACTMALTVFCVTQARGGAA